MLHNKHKKIYHFTKGKVKDRINIVIGNEKDKTKLHPSAKIKRWDGEVSSEITLITDNAKGKESYSDDGNVVTWEKGNLKAKFYQRYDVEGGGFEFEVHLPERPETNQIQFKVDTMGLNWYYQPPLTQQEINEGAVRPDNVVGSYAVYAKSPKANYVGGKEYKTGKVFHVYRPHIVDKLGKKTWGVFSLDKRKGILTITIDNDWLNNAAYPIIVDPTFGYTSVGATMGYLPNNYIRGVLHTGATGTATSISLYNYGYSGGFIKFALYERISSNNRSLVGYTSEAIITSKHEFQTLNFVSNPAISGVDYFISAFCNSTLSMVYDSVGCTLSNKALSYGAFPSSDTSSELGESLYYSLYTTYTVGSSSDIKTINELAKADIKTVNELALASVKSVNALE